ncbi:hypothetical protein MPTK1_1g25960 [Marchantia polymorpha subsp. ruderalis]
MVVTSSLTTRRVKLGGREGESSSSSAGVCFGRSQSPIRGGGGMLVQHNENHLRISRIFGQHEALEQCSEGDHVRNGFYCRAQGYTHLFLGTDGTR